MRIVLAWLKRQWDIEKAELVDTLKQLVVVYCVIVVIGAGMLTWLGFAMAMPLPWGIVLGWFPALVVGRIIIPHAMWFGILSTPLVYWVVTHVALTPIR